MVPIIFDPVYVEGFLHAASPVVFFCCIPSLERRTKLLESLVARAIGTQKIVVDFRGEDLVVLEREENL